MSKQKQYSATVILGGGGHTAEIIEILKVAPICFKQINMIVSTGDLLSVKKLMEINICKTIFVYEIPRPNEVLQKYSIAKIICSFLYSLKASLFTSSSFVLCNGPGVCVPFCIAHKLMHPFTPIWFIESLTRTTTLSVSGKVLQWIVNLFIVQSPFLAKDKYPRRIYQKIFLFI